jgi:hypothetical protein
MSIPTYETLYKKLKNGSINVWSIRIEPSNATPGSFTVITEHGLQGGKMIVHEHEIDKGKVKRTVLEQAAQFADKKWKDKTEKELFSKEIEPDVSEEVRPMLAKTFDFSLYEKKGRSFKIEFPAYVQTKYDGLRCMTYRKGSRIVMESRKGIPFQKFDTIAEEIEKLLQNNATIHLDGELFSADMPFEELSGLIRIKGEGFKKEDEARIAKVEYHIYDFVDTARPNLTYEERLQELTHIFDTVSKKTTLVRCKLVATYPVTSPQEVKRMHDIFVAEGHEGIMVRDPRGAYEINHRSKYLQKYKEFGEDEFKIAGFHQGTGDEAGLVIWDCLTKEGKPFAVRPRGTFELRRELFKEAANYVGQNITVIYQGVSEDGIPRFPVGKAVRELY